MEDNLKPLYFKVGDQVVTNRFETTPPLTFLSRMNEYVGKTGPIQEIFENCILVHGFYWPWSAIEHPNSLLQDDDSFNTAVAQEIKEREAFLNYHADWIKSQRDGELIYNEAINKLEIDKKIAHEIKSSKIKTHNDFVAAKNKLMVVMYDHFENQIDTAKVERMVEKYKANPCASPEVWIALEPMNEAEKQAFLNAIATLPESKYTWLKLTQEELSDLVHALDYTRDNYTGVWGENKRKRHFELQAMINKYISP
jgi:hypothetical protein